MKSYKQLYSLVGKTAFVCGGMGLIGKEISLAFSQAGAKTVILDVADTAHKQNPNILYEHFDATDLPSVENRIQELKRKYKTIDIWVNTFYPRTQDWASDIAHVTLESWRKNTDMQLTSYSWISRAVCLAMKQQKRGSLINLGSIYGVLGNDPSLYAGTKSVAPPAYAAIKGGIVNLTRYLASFFGSYNVRINTVCPGGVYDRQDKTFIKKYIAKTPLRRMATAQDVAGAILFLASDASSYITGTTMMVDGGFSCI